MGTPEKYSKEGMREGHPGSINPDEVGRNTPSKDISEQEKLNINQSESGKKDSYRPAEELIDDNISQIDEGTKNLRQQDGGQSSESEINLKGSYTEDTRDQNDSTEDWNAEKARSSHNK